MTTLAEKIRPILTLEAAREWSEASDQFLFVTECIEACDLRWTDALVEYVEAQLETLLTA